MNVDRKEGIVLFSKVRKGLQMRCFGEVSVNAVRPAVVLARQNLGVSGFIVDQRKSSVPADVMKPANRSLAIQDEDESKACLCDADIITSLLESILMRHHDPFF